MGEGVGGLNVEEAEEAGMGLDSLWCGSHVVGPGQCLACGWRDSDAAAFRSCVTRDLRGMWLSCEGIAGG